MNERRIEVKTTIVTLDERDNIVAALRPLVCQGWQIKLDYSFEHEPVLRHVVLGTRSDVFF